jgi:hypothetical protein
MILALAMLLAASDPPTLYQRLQQRFAADPAAAAALGRPAPQMREAAWLIGTWEVSTELEEQGGPPASGTCVIAPAMGGIWLEIRDSYPGGQQNLAYVGYSVAERHWVIAAIDGLNNANRGIAEAWTGDRIAFEGDYVVLGLAAHLRQTLERNGANEFNIVDEELVGGNWHRLAVRYYHRRSAT